MEIAGREVSPGSAQRSAGSSGAVTGAELSVAALFTLLWDALADMLGTAATATLLRRAALRATPHCAELSEVAIMREKLGYRYKLPSAWANGTGGTPIALRELVAELLPLLMELTGPVVWCRLERIPELRRHQIVSSQSHEEEDPS
jgi:hypothetical protein